MAAAALGDAATAVPGQVCRSHAAYHAKERSSPKKADARAVLTQVRRRMQDRLEFEHRN